jgi:hypothetical protein
VICLLPFDDEMTVKYLPGFSKEEVHLLSLFNEWEPGLKDVSPVSSILRI